MAGPDAPPELIAALYEILDATILLMEADLGNIQLYDPVDKTLAIVAQVAAEDPETVPKIAQPRMFTCIRRPGSQVSHGARPSNISSESFVRYRISPIQMNSGSAVSVQLLTEPQMVDGMTSSIGASAKSSMPRSAMPMSEAAIHKPEASRTSRATARIGL